MALLDYGHRPDELPPHEGVVEGVDVGGDERASPVDVEAHRHQVGLGLRGEVLEPVVAVGEQGNLESEVPSSVLVLVQPDLSHLALIMLLTRETMALMLRIS